MFAAFGIICIEIDTRLWVKSPAIFVFLLFLPCSRSVACRRINLLTFDHAYHNAGSWARESMGDATATTPKVNDEVSLLISRPLAAVQTAKISAVSEQHPSVKASDAATA